MGKKTSAEPRGGFVERVKAFFRPFTDGTIYDTFWYKQPGEERLHDLYQPSNGFSELKQRPTKTKRIDNYADIVKETESWQNLDEKMNAYFDDIINIFPYERRALDKDGRTSLKRLRIVNPENYFKIIISMIERRFPGGGGEGKIGDQDMRDMTCCLRIIYKKDLWDLIWRRRFSAIRALGGMVLVMACAMIASMAARSVWPLQGGLLSGGQLTVVGIAACLMLIFWFAHRSFLHQVKIKYESALKASAANLRNTLQPRLVELVTLIQQIMARMNDEKWDLKADNKLEQWPEMVRRWSKLSFWLTARVQAMEDFLQVQMWLIRRVHFGLRHFAGILSFLIWLVWFLGLPLLGVAVFLIWSWFEPAGTIWHKLAIWMAMVPQDISITSLALSVIAAILGHFIIDDAQNRNLPQIELQDILQMEDIMGHKDTKLHDAIAALIRREKISILHNEDLGTPKPR